MSICASGRGFTVCGCLNDFNCINFLFLLQDSPTEDEGKAPVPEHCKCVKMLLTFKPLLFQSNFTVYFNHLSIIFQRSSPKMWQFLRDCWKIIERLVRPFERSLRDRWKTIFMEDCRKTILNRFKKIWRPWNSLKDHLGIMKDLGDHWTFTERSLRDLSIFRVFQWSFRGLALCGMGVLTWWEVIWVPRAGI